MFATDVLNVIFEFLNDSYKRILSITVKELYTKENKYAINISDICNVNMFKWALQMKCPTYNIMKHIITSGDLETLKLAISRGFSYTSNDINHATKNGRLKCLIYLHDIGCEWDI